LFVSWPREEKLQQNKQEHHWRCPYQQIGRAFLNGWYAFNWNSVGTKKIVQTTHYVGFIKCYYTTSQKKLPC
jgi:hypothetical protein